MYEIYQDPSLDENNIKKNYIEPFLKSWEKIKKKATQYKCKNMKNPADLTINSELSYFLVDNGEKKFGMFLASAYEQMIDWQNSFIKYIL